MVQATYQTAFEIGLGSFPWIKILHPLAFVALGLLLVRFGSKRQIYRAMGIIVASMASIFFLLGLTTLVPNFLHLRGAYISGKSSIVEGVVENFRPAPALGPATESFSVHGVLFSYNALDDTPCFHDAPVHRVPIRNGLGVRVYYHEGCIQRVDIQRPGPVPMPEAPS
jgi:hypothetical protein